MSFACSLCRSQLAYMWHHQVGGRAIFPGAGMFEACTAAGAALLHDGQGGAPSHHLALQSVSITAPIPLDAARGTSLVLEVAVTLATGAVQLSSVQPGNRSVVSCHGTLAAALPELASVDSSPTQPAVSTILFGSLPEASQPSCAISADVRGADPGLAGYFVHPAAMDATLHLTAAAAAPSGPAKSEGTKVPTGLACLLVRLDAASCHLMYPLAVPDAKSAPDGSHRCSFQMLQPPAPAAFAISDLLVKQLPATSAVATSAVGAQPALAAAEADDMLYEIQWQASSSSAAVDEAACVSPTAAGAWRFSRSHRVEQPSMPDGSTIMADFASHGKQLNGVNGSASTLRGLELLQRLPPGGTLNLSTRGAFGAAFPAAVQHSTSAGSTSSAALAALLRVAINELPSSHIRSLDMHSSVQDVGPGCSEVSCVHTLTNEACLCGHASLAKQRTTHANALCCGIHAAHWQIMRPHAVKPKRPYRQPDRCLSYMSTVISMDAPSLAGRGCLRRSGRRRLAVPGAPAAQLSCCQRCMCPAGCAAVAVPSRRLLRPALRPLRPPDACCRRSQGAPIVDVSLCKCCSPSNVPACTSARLKGVDLHCME